MKRGKHPPGHKKENIHKSSEFTNKSGEIMWIICTDGLSNRSYKWSNNGGEFVKTQTMIIPAVTAWVSNGSNV